MYACRYVAPSFLPLAGDVIGAAVASRTSKMLADVGLALLIFAAAARAVANDYPAIMPHNLSQLTYPGMEEHMVRIWTKADLGRAISVPSYEQMGPLIRRLEAGLPITVLAFGDSITKDSGGCFHRDRCVQDVWQLH